MKPQLPAVLVVDDDASIRWLVKTLLENSFIVFEANNGKEAISIYQQHQDDIAMVLSDVLMPELCGPELLQELRKINPAVPCCFMTGGSGNHTIAELMAAGATRILGKPFQFSALLSALGDMSAPLSRR